MRARAIYGRLCPTFLQSAIHFLLICSHHSWVDSSTWDYFTHGKCIFLKVCFGLIETIEDSFRCVYMQAHARLGSTSLRLWKLLFLRQAQLEDAQ